jgi:hypothetical protein
VEKVKSKVGAGGKIREVVAFARNVAPVADVDLSATADINAQEIAI